jgi:hypothetical protein
MGNLLAPAPTGPVAPPPKLAPAGALHDDLGAAHDQALAKFDKISAAQKSLGQIATELTKLVSLGDLVTMEEVLGAAATLTGAGQDPRAMAGLLAEMPENGPALAQWLQQKLGSLQEKTAQLVPAGRMAQHDVGVAALRQLAAHSLAAPPQAPAGAGSPLTVNSGQGPIPGPGGNALAPGVS